MEKIKKLFKPKDFIINTSPKIKMSELISAYASDYINMGEDTEERRNYKMKNQTAISALARMF